MRFNVPLTDPRWLDATEEDVLDDMLVCMYYDAAVREATDPNAALRNAMERDGDAFVEVDRSLLDELRPDGELGARLERIKATTQQVKKIAEIRFAGRVVTRGE